MDSTPLSIGGTHHCYRASLANDDRISRRMGGVDKNALPTIGRLRKPRMPVGTFDQRRERPWDICGTKCLGATLELSSASHGVTCP
jgi:hypothetical protein